MAKYKNRKLGFGDYKEDKLGGGIDGGGGGKLPLVEECNEYRQFKFRLEYEYVPDPNAGHAMPTLKIKECWGLLEHWEECEFGTKYICPETGEPLGVGEQLCEVDITSDIDNPLTWDDVEHPVPNFEPIHIKECSKGCSLPDESGDPHPLTATCECWGRPFLKGLKHFADVVGCQWEDSAGDTSRRGGATGTFFKFHLRVVCRVGKRIPCKKKDDYRARGYKCDMCFAKIYGKMPDADHYMLINSLKCEISKEGDDKSLEGKLSPFPTDFVRMLGYSEDGQPNEMFFQSICIFYEMMGHGQVFNPYDLDRTLDTFNYREYYKGIEIGTVGSEVKMDEQLCHCLEVMLPPSLGDLIAAYLCSKIQRLHGENWDLGFGSKSVLHCYLQEAMGCIYEEVDLNSKTDTEHYLNIISKLFVKS